MTVQGTPKSGHWNSVVEWRRQLGMGSDPINSIFFGGEFSKVVHGAIRPYYLHAPNLALSHRQ